MSIASSFESDRSFYLALARQAPELSREREAQLIQRFRDAGDQKAGNLLAAAHQRHVIGLALKYRGYRLPLGELVAEGNLGVMQALRKFEPERGVRFGTYAAYWARAMMLAYVIKTRSVASGAGGALRSQVFFKLRRERARIYGELGGGANADRELAARLGLSPERLQNMLQRLDTCDVSLDADDQRGHGGLLETLSSCANQEAELQHHESARRRSHLVAEAVSLLDSRERRIVEEHVMADHDDARSLAEIARSLGISRERARQLQTRALSKLRRHMGESARGLVA